MPELPEIECSRRYLMRHNIIERTIVEVEVRLPSVISGDAEQFCRTVRGRTIEGLYRHGKVLLLPLAKPQNDTCIVTVHFGMTGKLWIAPFGGEEREKYERVHFHLDDGRILRFIEVRTMHQNGRGAFRIYDTGDEARGRLGFDALEDNGADLDEQWERLFRRNRQIKHMLLDQQAIAGLGNIYSTEALWHAGVHPQTKASEIPQEKRERLRIAVGTLLRHAIEKEGTNLKDGLNAFRLPHGEPQPEYQKYLKVYGHTTCTVCGGEIKKYKESNSASARSTYFCPACQR